MSSFGAFALVMSNGADDAPRPDEIVANWSQPVMAVAAIAAFIVALVVFFSDRKKREEERFTAREAQARLIRFERDSHPPDRTSDGMVFVDRRALIRNTSDERITEIVAMGTLNSAAPELREALRLPDEQLPHHRRELNPNDEESVSFIQTGAWLSRATLPGAVTLVASVEFTDAKGYRWRRSLDGDLTPITSARKKKRPRAPRIFRARRRSGRAKKSA